MLFGKQSFGLISKDVWAGFGCKGRGRRRCHVEIRPKLLSDLQTEQALRDKARRTLGSERGERHKQLVRCHSKSRAEGLSPKEAWPEEKEWLTSVDSVGWSGPASFSGKVTLLKVPPSRCLALLEELEKFHGTSVII